MMDNYNREISYIPVVKRQKTHRVKLVCDFIPLDEADVFIFVERLRNLLLRRWEIEHVGPISDDDGELVTLVAVLKKDCLEVTDCQGEQSMPDRVVKDLTGREYDE